MSETREKITGFLKTLIARKDARVFKTREVFVGEMCKLGDCADMPETEALSAGLLARFPWELQKDGGGVVSERTSAALSRLLTENYGISPELAAWAVGAWASALGLKMAAPPAAEPDEATLLKALADFESANGLTKPNEAPKKSVPEKPQKPVPELNKKPEVLPQTAEKSAPAPIKGCDSYRFGVIFGETPEGFIKVFDIWFNSLPDDPAMAATPVKIEELAPKPLFSAPPQTRKKAAQEKKKNQPAPAAAPKAPESQAAPAVQKPAPSLQAKPAPARRAAAPVSSASAGAAKPPVRISQTKVYYGTADSLFKQGLALLPGRSANSDIKEALGMLSQAARQGSLIAKRVIGMIYLNGIGTSKDLREAVKWLKLAADGGETEAQYQLGNLYYNGTGVSQDLNIAIELLSAAAGNGHAKAEALLDAIAKG